MKVLIETRPEAMIGVTAAIIETIERFEIRKQKTTKKNRDIPGELKKASAQMAATIAASSEINWSAGTEADMEGEDTTREPERVAAVLIGTEAETAVILEKRESWHKREMCWSSPEK